MRDPGLRRCGKQKYTRMETEDGIRGGGDNEVVVDPISIQDRVRVSGTQWVAGAEKGDGNRGHQKVRLTSRGRWTGTVTDRTLDAKEGQRPGNVCCRGTDL